MPPTADLRRGLGSGHSPAASAGHLNYTWTVPAVLPRAVAQPVAASTTKGPAEDRPGTSSRYCYSRSFRILPSAAVKTSVVSGRMNQIVVPSSAFLVEIGFRRC